MKISEKEIEEKIMEIAHKRGNSSSCCPSEAARSLSDENWHHLMPDIRKMALKLREQGKIDIFQQGSKIQEEKLKGPIRLRISHAE